MYLGATQLGPRASDLIAQDARGVCIARFDQSAYLRTSHGLVCLIKPSLPMGPVNIEVSTLPNKDQHLLIDQRLARIWRPKAWPRPLDWRMIKAKIEPAALPDDMSSLLGCGPGLTPEGDDVIAGYLLARHAVGDPFDAEALLADAVDRTNEISRTHLAAAATGLGLEPFHDLLGALLDPRCLDPAPALAAARAVGSSSGEAAVRGIMACLWERAAS